MTSEPWQMVGTIASTAGVTTFAIGGAKGIVAGYQTYASPYTFLTEAEKKLKRVRSRLQGLSPKRREEIEIAARSESFNDSSLEILEERLDDLSDMHCRLSKRIEKTTFTERHFPYSDFRQHLSRFEEHAKGLLNDTLNTTVPCVDDIEFKPENSRRAMAKPSNSESTSNPENSRRAVEGPSSSESTFDPENSRRALERSSSSKSTPNPENSRWAMKGLSSSESRESWNTARESFSDPGGIPLSRMV